MQRHFDTIVIGVGAMGAATCFELAKRGQKVLGVEQYDIPHQLGSSHGHTRIIRKTYFEGSSYVPMLERSFELWHEIQKISERNLFVQTGSLDIGLPESSVFSGSVKSCKAHELKHEILSAKEVNQRYPGYHLPENLIANFQPDGGFLIPEKCIVSFVEAAQNLGAEIHARTKVIAWNAEGSSVEVITDKGKFKADRLVMAAGAWNSKLLPELKQLCIPERQVLGWFQTSAKKDFSPSNFPVFVFEIGDDNFYGFPIHEIPGFKFGKYRHRFENVDPDSFNRNPNAKDEEILRTFAAKFFPKGNGPTMALKTCMFTNTPDGHFILDRHPKFPQVLIAGGFSGHGFKFSSVIGEIMAEMVIDGKSKFALDMFSLRRFAKL